MRLHNCLKIGFAITCLSVSLALSSCIRIEMRDSSTASDIDTTDEVDTSSQTLAQASRKNTLETSTEESVEEVTEVNAKDVLNISICGNITIDDSIISDASNRAGDGKSYSFLRMFTGIYNLVSSSDIAFGSYTEQDKTQLPDEAVGAVYDLGIDVLNIGNSSAFDTADKYDITEVKEGSENIVINKNGLNIACLSVSGVDYKDDKYQSEIEYSDFVSDIVIVFVDWGSDDSTADKSNVIYNIAQSGADIIIGNGSALGKIEWVDTGDGALTLAAYSLGNIITSSDNIDNLCGGILNLSVAYGGGTIELDDVTLNPTVIHYTNDDTTGLSGFQVFTFNEYSDEIAANHAVNNVSVDKLKDKVENIIDEDFLPDYLR